MHWRIVAGATLPHGESAVLLVEFKVNDEPTRRTEVRLDTSQPLFEQLNAKLRALAAVERPSGGVVAEDIVGTEGQLTV